MRFSQLDGLALAVWGVGGEIRSFADHLERRLPRTRIVAVVIDEGGDDSGAAPLIDAGARLVAASDVPAALGDIDVLVRSPGVTIHRPELQALRAAGTPVVTATALWLAEREGRNVLGITATKGKSTTATLVAHLAKAVGLPVHLAGNIGRPALDLLDEPDGDLAVVELSSYQIADLTTGPETAFVGNLFKEHVSWHGTEAAYRADKLRLLTLPGVRRCVLNATAPDVMAAARGDGEVWTFGLAPGWHVRDGGIAHGDDLIVAAADLPLLGAHNALNLCGALTALEAIGAPAPALPDALDGMHGLPHRLEPVLEGGGVLWVDDSISTTPESAIAALASFPDRDIILLAGGEDRGQEHGALARELAARRATVIAMPVTGERLAGDARAAGLPDERVLLAEDLDAAVAAACAAAAPGAVVLLSPAAPSYHAYVNYQARGDHFAALARGRTGQA